MRSFLITGLIGAGKTTFAHCVTKAGGGEVFHTDQQAKKFLQPESPCYNRLKQALGTQCLNKDGTFNHHLLADEIFKQNEKRKVLEALVHPLVKKSFENFIKKRKTLGFSYTFCEAPLVSQSFMSLFDTRILIACPSAIRKTRLIKKGWTIQNISLRETTQIPLQHLQDKMDFVIDNSKAIEDLSNKAKKLLRHLNLPTPL